jgi:hypothetical protein
MKSHYFFYYAAICFFFFTACNKTENDSTTIEKEYVSGYAQKGPFVNGSSVTISELNKDLNQTGKTYHTTISNNSGSFELKNIKLISQYTEFKVDGYYYNEISAQTSGGLLTLYAVADLQDISSVNVNVLTHLEKPRVEYLIKQKGMSFVAAKKQAQKEVLAVFGFQPEDHLSETLNLTSDAKLLAISCILQGYLSTGDMLGLMAEISADIQEDGKLDNLALGSKLINNAISINAALSEIRNNISKKYTELGINVNIPDFENYVESFINSGLYTGTIAITYPETGISGDNILSDHVTEMTTMRGPVFNYCMKADVPAGLSLKIILKGGNYGSWSFGSNAPPINWNKGELEYDPSTGIDSQVFNVIESGKPNEFPLNAFDPFGEFGQTLITDQSYIKIEYYENGATTPTKVKTLKIISSY